MAKHRYITLARYKDGSSAYLVRFCAGTQNAIDRCKILYQKCFRVSHYGSKKAALAAAIADRDTMARKLGKPLTQNHNHHRHFKTAPHDNTSGFLGVGYEYKDGRLPRVYASWSMTMPDGTRQQRRRTRSFLNEPERKEALAWAIRLRKRMEKKHYTGPQGPKPRKKDRP